MVKFPALAVTDKGWGMILICCANTDEQYKTKAQKKEKDFNMVTIFNNDDEFFLSILLKMQEGFKTNKLQIVVILINICYFL